MNPKIKIAALLAAAGAAALGAFSSLPGRNAAATAAVQAKTERSAPPPKPNKNGKVVLTDAQWRRLLTPAQYDVLRHAGTEAPYSHPYNKLHDKGTFACAGCGLPLFSSETKFESGTGWPSFYQPISKTAVRNIVDRTEGMERTEVRCSRCDGHLGHVFDDGPRPTGLRYCMNGLALKFVPAPKSNAALSASAAPVPAEAAEAKPKDNSPKEQKVSLDLQNAPIREALERLFQQTKSDFSLDNSVQGYITLKVTDQPFESALGLLLSRSAVPITYTKESGVYFNQAAPYPVKTL